MDAPWLAGRSIVMLEPRRLAAVAVAARIADLLGEPLGRRAGYTVRTASRVSRDTRILVVTEALLTRKIQEDPLLAGVGLVILDEFHERSIHADLALALALEVRRARGTSRSWSCPPPWTRRPWPLFWEPRTGPAPSLHCPGSSHPVDTRYWALGQGRTLGGGFCRWHRTVVR